MERIERQAARLVKGMRKLAYEERLNIIFLWRRTGGSQTGYGPIHDGGATNGGAGLFIMAGGAIACANRCPE